MTISFYAYVYETDKFYTFPEVVEQRMNSTLPCSFEQLMDNEFEPEENPHYDSRLDINLAKDNAREILNLLGFVGNPDDHSPVKISEFRDNLTTACRKRFGKDLSPELEPTQIGNFFDCGRRAGYVEEILQRLLQLVQAAIEYDCAYIGWG